MSEALRKAAAAVVARWDSPDWKDGTHTADYINALRAALAAPPAQTPPPRLTDGQIYSMWVDATIETCSHENCYKRGVQDGETAVRRQFGANDE